MFVLPSCCFRCYDFTREVPRQEFESFFYCIHASHRHYYSTVPAHELDKRQTAPSNEISQNRFMGSSVQSVKQAVAVVTDKKGKQHAMVGKGTRHFGMNSMTRTVYAKEAIPYPTNMFSRNILQKKCAPMRTH
jgi:hypothetical protein